ncbi:MAG: ABC transporter permease [Gammaproteobacteria bacterium]
MNAVLLKILGKRLGLGFLTLAVLAAFIFSVVELLPGDLAEEVLGQSATPDTVAAFRRELGLDKPPLTRFLEWSGGALRGDFGNSLANGRPVAELVAGRLGNTLFLAGYAALIAVPLALVLGIAAALWRNTWFDRAANAGALSAISLPEFFVAYLLVLAFSVHWGVFPSLSNIHPGAPLGEKLYKTFLPAITLTLVVVAHMMRMTRAAIINLLASPYIEMARLKGLRAARIILVHALPNAAAPIVNVIAVNLAYLVVGVVVVEVVFVYPGLGQLMVDSVSKRDIPVVQATSLIFASVYILLNLLADIISIASNPRLLHPR